MGGGATTTGGPAKSPRPGRPKKTETPAAAGCGVASAKRPRNVIARIVFFMGIPPCPSATTAVAQRYDARAQAPTKVRTGERQWLWTELPSQPPSYNRVDCVLYLVSGQRALYRGGDNPHNLRGMAAAAAWIDEVTLCHDPMIKNIEQSDAVLSPGVVPRRQV